MNKEIREENGTTVITEKDAPAGMGAIYPEDLSECQGSPEHTEKKFRLPDVHPWANTRANMGGLR